MKDWNELYSDLKDHLTVLLSLLILIIETTFLDLILFILLIIFLSLALHPPGERIIKVYEFRS